VCERVREVQMSGAQPENYRTQIVKT
jgi:hypothetical protein